MLYLVSFEINQYISFQYHMVKNQVHIIVSAGNAETILLTNKSKTASEFKQKLP